MKSHMRNLLVPIICSVFLLINYSECEAMPILIHESQSPDKDTKKVIVKMMEQCCGSVSVRAAYMQEENLPHYASRLKTARTGEV
ncbi:hypothetical protein D918_00324 [Trichuris suis]|nr:hypothetical protein D918_00324 [Trichuris suis]